MKQDVGSSIDLSRRTRYASYSSLRRWKPPETLGQSAAATLTKLFSNPAEESLEVEAVAPLGDVLAQRTHPALEDRFNVDEDVWHPAHDEHQHVYSVQWQPFAQLLRLTQRTRCSQISRLQDGQAQGGVVRVDRTGVERATPWVGIMGDDRARPILSDDSRKISPQPWDVKSEVPVVVAQERNVVDAHDLGCGSLLSLPQLGQPLRRHRRITGPTIPTRRQDITDPLPLVNKPSDGPGTVSLDVIRVGRNHQYRIGELFKCRPMLLSVSVHSVVSKRAGQAGRIQPGQERYRADQQ